MREFRVLLTDDNGNEFYRDWSPTAKFNEAIRWTLEYYYREEKIIKVEIKEK